MTEQEAEALARRWVRIWKPDGLRSFPTRGDNPLKPSEDFQGVFWDFEFKDRNSICLRARIDSDALLIVKQSVYGPYYEFSLVGEGDAEGMIECDMGGEWAGDVGYLDQNADCRDFANKWRPFFRHNCWLSGCPIEATVREKANWIQSLSQEEIEVWKLEILSEPIDREARRIAAAFELETFELNEEDDEQMIYVGNLDTVRVGWNIDARTNTFVVIWAGNVEDGECLIHTEWYPEGKEWRLSPMPEFHSIMARGLYRLGFEDESVFSQLPALSAHEKLELRLSMPREFWPKIWLNEER
ncbi:hypothetical protein EON83_20890 [bacterium]|nr:MAG: hypothetical protein EON83_20890 [bacterium]